jgi:hypothetical protein
LLLTPDMNYVFLALGVLLYLAIATDIIKTTLSLQGGGWLTSSFSHIFWMLLLKLSGSNGRSRLLEHAGYLMLILILNLWVLCLWTSFFLLLLFQPDSIISSSSRLPADAWQKLYYAGFTLSTLGVGDYIGSENVWRLLTNVYAFTGLVLITMSITYFVPVLSAVIKQRNLDIMLSSIGKTPQQLIINSWDGKSFHRLVAQASDLANMLIEHNQSHKAYPVIHYFHTRKVKHAIILRIATLYEALLLLNQRVKKEIRPSSNDLSSLETALENYLEVIKEVASFKKASQPPALPPMEQLQEWGLVDSSQTNTAFEESIQQKRVVLLSLVQQDGWHWQDVYSDKSS